MHNAQLIPRLLDCSTARLFDCSTTQLLLQEYLFKHNNINIINRNYYG